MNSKRSNEYSVCCPVDGVTLTCHAFFDVQFSINAARTTQLSFHNQIIHDKRAQIKISFITVAARSRDVFSFESEHSFTVYFHLSFEE